jgi:Serine/threonine protein kinase
MNCPHCGAAIRGNARFCGTCGNNISGTLTTPQNNTGNTSNTGTMPIVSSSKLSVGSRLQNDRYIIKKVLGQGGMGAALLASDARLDNKLVVIKELISDNVDPTQHQDDVRNFKREVSTLARIDHPLVPNVTDHFQEGARYFMVQEYVEGENLEAYLERIQKPMAEREVLVCASEILDVLDYLSQQTPPIVHRDIKPANIIIGRKDRRGHLVDFGIARADELKNAQRKQTSALGTPGYAPPEQYQGNADERSDLYALAATLHHLLTNRDPREYAPFFYPPVRTLSSQLTPDIEGILQKALNNDITQRYQNALEMKRDIDTVLRQRFGISRNIDTYMLGASGPINAVNPSSGAGITSSSSPTLPTQAGATVAKGRQINTPVPPAPVTPPTPLPYTTPTVATVASGNPGRRGGPTPVQPLVAQPAWPPTPRKRRNRLFPILLVVLILLVIVIAFPLVITHMEGTKATTPGVTATGIGVTMVNSEPIGISDGTIAFDTSLVDGNDKIQAAQDLKSDPTNFNPAIASLTSALSKNVNDAEALIYRENIDVMRSKSPYVTLVVATMLSGPDADISVGRSNLQGAYVAQKEFNDGSRLRNGVQVRLLIANAGSDANNATRVAQQTIQLSQKDKTFVGIMGWPFSAYTQTSINLLKNANIPMVSESASSDALSGLSPAFFRVIPTNIEQGQQGAAYAANKLHAHAVALFSDPANSYSQTLALDFKKAFEQSGQNKVVDQETYTIGKPATIASAVQNALTHNIDLIYFSGYANDISTLLVNLPAGNLPVLGGDALYELGGYSQSARQNFSRLHFTTGAYPDEWDVLGHSKLKPAFFNDYSTYFNSDGSHPGGQYGFTRPSNDVILSYDATLALLTAYNNILGTKTNGVSPQDEVHALAAITGNNSIQGVSGQIAFDKDGNAIDKAVVVLYVDANDRIHMDQTPLGRFLK